MRKLYGGLDAAETKYGALFWKARRNRFAFAKTSIHSNIPLYYTIERNDDIRDGVFDIGGMVGNKIADTGWGY